MNTHLVNPQRTDKPVALGSLAGGDVFRFATDSTTEASTTDGFWMKLDAPEIKDRARIANIRNGKVLERDTIHQVVRHDTRLHIEV